MAIEWNKERKFTKKHRKHELITADIIYNKEFLIYNILWRTIKTNTYYYSYFNRYNNNLDKTWKLIDRIIKVSKLLKF